MKALYLDCFSGISGDMFLGALFDLGLSFESFYQELSGLGVSFELAVNQVTKGCIQATQVQVIDRDHHSHHHHHRQALDLIKLTEKSSLRESVRKKTVAALWAIARAEGKIHGKKPEEVHLHELSGVDTLVDLAGTFLGLEMLGVVEVSASPVRTGRGWIESAHGLLPIPAPATLELLKGIPVYPGETNGEFTTPTGAALLSGLNCRFDSDQPLSVERTGYGAGQKNFPHPNVLRLVLGQTSNLLLSEKNIVIETNLDDMTPQVIEYLSERLFQAGALDVFLSPITMKKFRAGFRLTVLAKPDQVESLQSLIFEETSTLGIRSYQVTKTALPRTELQIETQWGPVRAKVSTKPAGPSLTPEYEDCKNIARTHRVPLLEVLRTVERLGTAHIRSS